MASSFGTALRVTIFGQSHSPAIGCVVEGLPAGFPVNQEALAAFMARRAPGQGAWATTRKEADAVRIVGGLNPMGSTCGTPLACLIENTNAHSSDYDELRRVPRPGHADLTAQIKWQGAQDVAGGGHFSGRLTAPLCAAGGIALQVLEARGVHVAAHLAEVAGIADEPFAARDADTTALERQMARLAAGATFPTLSVDAGAAMRDAIEAARAAGDSVGGIVECVAIGMPAGVGSPLFDGIESTIARIAFGVGAVKGIEFGAGFDASRKRGSENNDPYAVVDGRVIPAKNDAGGNLGGITTGAPILFRMAMKPTPSIAREQRSVNLETMEEQPLVIRGRHDPCIAPRAVPVAEAIMALALLDSWLAFPPEGR